MDKQRDFLDRYIFCGWGPKRVSFDAASIPHFTPSAFLQVLERCQRFGVQIHGIEIFSASGEALHDQLSEDGSPLLFFPAVVPFTQFDGLTCCATFGVPDALLAEPAVPQELIESYTTSEYHVQVEEERFSIRVGQRSPELEQLLREHGHREAYLLTACSPFSRGRRASDNIATATLRLQLEKANTSILSAVAALGTSWEEVGFLALGLRQADAHRFGAEYGQNAMLAIQSDGTVDLVLLRWSPC